MFSPVAASGSCHTNVPSTSKNSAAGIARSAGFDPNAVM